MKTQLMLSRASDALAEANATRRAVDGKIHSLLGMTLALLGLLVALGVWASLRPLGRPIFVVALIIYLAVTGLGLFASYPRAVNIPSARAILEFQDKATYDNLADWVVESTIELVEENARMIGEKSSLLEIMAVLVVLASGVLVVSTLM